jgi:GT2 family glycosyltransferase
MILIVALMTCHNRRQKTLASIEQYFSCELRSDYSRELVLVDDGSTDGTSDEVRARFPKVTVILGDGNLFWNRGMLVAWKKAIELDPSYVLWLNDDTILDRRALEQLLMTDFSIRQDTGRAGISVGSTHDEHGLLSYGGARATTPINRLKTRKVFPGEKPVPVQTMNGNCVLIPKEVFDEIGLLDNVFLHAMGDVDYGFRATKAGIPVWIAPGFCGFCSQGERMRGTYNDTTLSLKKRWRDVTSAKGLPFSSWFTFTRRHAGKLWMPIYLWPYIKILMTSLMKGVQRRQN